MSGADIVSYALTQRGDPYVWGAEGPDAFDCSGLVEYVYKHFGLDTPRTTQQMIRSTALQPVQRKDLQPGDLIFSNWTGATSSHVGIYTGSGSIIEAPEPGKNVTLTTLGPNYWAHVDAMRRVPGVSGSTGPSTGGSTGGILEGVKIGLESVPGVSSMLGGLIPNPTNVTDALSNVGTALTGVAEGAMGVGNLATLLTRAFLPSNMIRATAFFFGTIFIIVGIWFLAREIKESK